MENIGLIWFLYVITPIAGLLITWILSKKIVSKEDAE